MYVLGGSVERSVSFAPRREHVGLARRQQAGPRRREAELQMVGAVQLAGVEVELAVDRGADVLGQLPRFRQMAAEAGRDLESLPVSIFGAEMDEDMLKQYRDAGMERVVFSLESEEANQVLPMLDKINSLIQSVG